MRYISLLLLHTSSAKFNMALSSKRFYSALALFSFPSRSDDSRSTVMTDGFTFSSVAVKCSGISVYLSLLRLFVLELYSLLLYAADVRVESVTAVSALRVDLLACDGFNVLDLYRIQGINCNHNRRASLLSTQKNRKMKKPCEALRITKRIWRAVEALESANPNIVSAPTSHVSPKRNIILVVLMSNLIAVFLLICALVRSSLFRMCLISTAITMIKMTILKNRMAKMGPRKAPKNTARSKTKQL